MLIKVERNRVKRRERESPRRDVCLFIEGYLLFDIIHKFDMLGWKLKVEILKTIKLHFIDLLRDIHSSWLFGVARWMMMIVRLS